MARSHPSQSRPVGRNLLRLRLAFRIGLPFDPILETAPPDVSDDTVERTRTLRARYVENRGDRHAMASPDDRTNTRHARP